MKKHIANIITGSRIIFSLPLLFIPLSSAWFYVFYLFCGLTDMIDGGIARKMGAVSKFGSSLDTVADLVFMLVCWVKIFPLLNMPVWLWVWIISVALIKIFNIAHCFARKRELISVHSVLNKITGFALFLLPLSLAFIEIVHSASAICVLATVAAIQEAYFIKRS